MYLPRNRYKIDQAQPGELTTASGREYTGPVIRLSSGRVFSGSNINKPGPELVYANPTRRLAIDRPYNDYYGPTDNDYAKGYFTRYFTRDKRNGRFVELSKNQWNDKRGLNYVLAGKLEWILTGPLEDGKINNIPYKGVSTRNLEILQDLEKDFPGITNFFDNPGQFVR